MYSKADAKPHSPRAHAAYHDLRRLLLDDAVADLIGTPP